MKSFFAGDPHSPLIEPGYIPNFTPLDVFHQRDFRNASVDDGGSNGSIFPIACLTNNVTEI